MLDLGVPVTFDLCPAHRLLVEEPLTFSLQSSQKHSVSVRGKAGLQGSTRLMSGLAAVAFSSRRRQCKCGAMARNPGSATLWGLVPAVCSGSEPRPRPRPDVSDQAEEFLPHSSVSSHSPPVYVDLLPSPEFAQTSLPVFPNNGPSRPSLPLLPLAI